MMDKQLEGIDLNLLLVLHWLLAERNVTAAAVKLGLSQPAASRSLGRLRNIFDDPLLVKVGGEMVPTPMAERIQPSLKHAIETCRDVLRVSGVFVPETQTGTFTLACADYIGALAVVLWENSVRKFAPNLALKIIPPTLECARDCVTGKVDMCILPDISVLNLPPTIDVGSFVQKPLLEQDFLCAIRHDHPLAGKEITLDDYTALDHVFISQDNSRRGLVDRALEKVGRERRIMYRTESFLMAVPIVRFTNSVVTAARPLVEMRSDQLYIFEPPVPMPSLPLYAVWHPNWTLDSRHQWVRSQIFGALADDTICPFSLGNPLV